MILIFAVISAAKSFFSEIEVVTPTPREISTTVLEETREIKPREYFDSIVNNNIFDANLIPKKIVKPKEKPVKPLKWELQGTMSIMGEYVAYIIDKGKRRKRNEPFVVSTGYISLEYDLEILEIRKNYVRYRRFGTEEGELVKEPAPIFGGFKPKKDYSGIVEMMSQGDFLVSLSGIKKEIPDIDSVIQSIEAKPYANPAEPNTILGLKVTRIPSDSILIALGINNDYIIKSIEGKTVDSKEKAVSALKGIEIGKKLKVRIIRDGRDRTLVYEIKR